MLGIPKKALIVVGVVLGLALIYTKGSEQRSSGSEPESASESQGSEDTAQCRMTVTADILNVRAGPGTQHDIVGKFQQDAETEASREVRDGFRKISANHWAADEYLSPLRGADCG